MRFYGWVTAIALATTGCSVPAGESYRVVIDPAFTAQEQEDILDAAADWQAKVPVTLTIVIAKCASAADGEICVHASTGAEVERVGHNQAGLVGYTVCPGGLDGGDVYVDVAKAGPITFAQTVEHEMGHAMGLKHAQVGSLMYWKSDGAATTAQPADVEQWLSTRGQGR